jgi:N-acetyltransferase
MNVHPVTLAGTRVRLEPLSLSHLDGLCEVGLDAALWRYSQTLVESRDDMRAYVETALRLQAEGAALPFTVVERASGRAVGSSRYAAIDRGNRHLEIGWTWYAPAWQRTAINTETKYLMLRHAFETLGCLRVEFKTDSLNERSRAALLRIGAKEEGVFRRHMIMPGGRIRDSVYFSIIDSEWPSVKGRLERFLSPPAAAG